MEDKNKEYEKLKRQDKAMKNTAKLWGGVFAVIVVVAVVWAIASHLL